MAARKYCVQHDEKTKRRIQASQLLNRLILFATGRINMTTAQVLAAKIVIAKSIPDVKSVEHSGPDGGAIPHAHTHTLTPEEAYFRMVRNDEGLPRK